MRQNFLNGVDIKNYSLGSFFLKFLFQLLFLVNSPQLFDKLDVGLVARASRQNMPLDRNSQKCQIADKIERFVADKISLSKTQRRFRLISPPLLTLIGEEKAKKVFPAF